MSVLVTGARGVVGSGLVHRLHAMGIYLRAASRAPQRLELPEGIPVVELDLAHPGTFAPALIGVTGVFLYAEPTAIHELLAAASHAGVKKVVLLSGSAVNDPLAEHDPLAHDFLQVERALLRAPLRCTRLRPGMFMTNALGWSTAIRGGNPVEQAYPDAHTAPIHPSDIVDVAEMALTTDQLEEQAINMGGPQSLSFRDQVDILGELLGQRIELRELTPEQAIKHMGRQFPTPIAESLVGHWSRSNNRVAATDDTVEPITRQPARTFRDWAAENLDRFRSPT